MAMRHGDWIDPVAGRLTFGEFALAWQVAQVHRATTAALVDSHLRRISCRPAFGSRPLSEIRSSEVQAWVRGRNDQLAPATVETAFSYLLTTFLGAWVRTP